MARCLLTLMAKGRYTMADEKPAATPVEPKTATVSVSTPDVSPVAALQEAHSLAKDELKTAEAVLVGYEHNIGSHVVATFREVKDLAGEALERARQAARDMVSEGGPEQ